MADPVEPRGGRDWVAIILAIAIGTALNVIVGAVLYDAVFSKGPGLSENATQILTGAFGGIIGVLGSYVGGRSVERAHQRERGTVANGTDTEPGP